MQKLLLGVGIFVILLLIIGLAIPRHSRFVVATQIDAHPATVFALVNSMRRRELWSPITANDPNVQVEYSGPERGTGATVTWNGVIAGSGTQTIVESRPFDRVECLINSGEAGEARSWFEIGGRSGHAIVNRGFEHDYGFNIIGRYFGLIVTGVIRRDYQNSLEALKEAAESLPTADFSGLVVEHIRVEPLTIAYVRASSSPNPAAVSEALGAAYAEVLRFIDDQRLIIGGAPLSIARAYAGAELRFDAGIPVRGVTEATPHESGKLKIGTTYGGAVIRTAHPGGYDRLGETHRKIAAYMAALGIEQAGDAWESYVSDPAKTDERELLTYVYYPVRGEP